MPRRTPYERFMAKVRIDPKMGCWEWLGGVHRKKHPYGRFWYDGRLGYAHRFAYEYFVGPIPVGTELDHFVCQNTICANPAHLEPVTHHENLMRGTGIAARNARVTHCPQGHEYTFENTYRTATNGRACRTCARLKARARRKAQK